MGDWRRGPFAVLWCAGQALELAGSALRYLAVGTLRLRDLRAAITNTWEEFGRSEDMIVSGLMPWEQALFDRFLKPDDRILVVGCGTGRDLIALLKRGYQVEGLDVGPRAIALARQMLGREGLSAEIYTGPIEDLSLPGSFDVFIFSWFCYSYIPTSQTRIAVLRKVQARLTPGGRILISYIPAERPPRSLPVGLTQLVARLAGSDWRPELGDAVVPAGGGWKGVHYEHRFQEGEFEQEARAAGLTIIFHQRRDEATAVLTV